MFKEKYDLAYYTNFGIVKRFQINDEYTLGLYNYYQRKYQP